jgi:hypothetical protein
MTIADAIWRTPLAVPLVLMPVRNERLGGSGGGPDYVTKASLSAKNRARAFLEKHFEIVAKPLAEIGWMLGADTQLKI